MLGTDFGRPRIGGLRSRRGRLRGGSATGGAGGTGVRQCPQRARSRLRAAGAEAVRDWRRNDPNLGKVFDSRRATRRRRRRRWLPAAAATNRLTPPPATESLAAWALQRPGLAERRSRAMPEPRARYWIRQRRQKARRIITRCSMLSRRTKSSRRRASTLAYSITASRGWRRARRHPIERCQIGGLPMRRRRSNQARSGMPERTVRRVAFPCRTNQTSAQLPVIIATATENAKG